MKRHFVMALLYVVIALTAYAGITFGLFLLPASKLLGVTAIGFCGYLLIEGSRIYYNAATGVTA